MSDAERFHRSLRASASLLLTEGHRYPQYYPLSKLWMEAELARERINLRIATESSLLRSVIVSVLSADKTGMKNLQDQLKTLTDG